MTKRELIKLTLKDWAEEIGLLPFGVKFIAVVLAILLIVGGVSAAFGCMGAEMELRKLHKQNTQLEKAAASAQTRAAAFETTAANEALRATALEAQLKSLQEKGKLQDNEINTQTQNTSRNRTNLSRIRRAPARSISTDELEQRLDARYGQKVSR